MKQEFFCVSATTAAVWWEPKIEAVGRSDKRFGPECGSAVQGPLWGSEVSAKQRMRSEKVRSGKRCYEKKHGSL